jgi:hypothetical protein
VTTHLEVSASEYFMHDLVTHDRETSRFGCPPAGFRCFTPPNSLPASLSPSIAICGHDHTFGAEDRLLNLGKKVKGIGSADGFHEVQWVYWNMPLLRECRSLPTVSRRGSGSSISNAIRYAQLRAKLLEPIDQRDRRFSTTHLAEGSRVLVTSYVYWAWRKGVLADLEYS